jgi:hypothetical protein
VVADLAHGLEVAGLGFLLLAEVVLERRAFGGAADRNLLEHVRLAGRQVEFLGRDGLVCRRIRLGSKQRRFQRLRLRPCPSTRGKTPGNGKSLIERRFWSAAVDATCGCRQVLRRVAQ